MYVKCFWHFAYIFLLYAYIQLAEQPLQVILKEHLPTKTITAMKNFLVTVLCLAFASCSTDVNPDNDGMNYAEYNQKVVEYLQKKYNVEADVEFSPDYKRKLSKEEVESYENFYKFIGSLKERSMEMT